MRIDVRYCKPKWRHTRWLKTERWQELIREILRCALNGKKMATPSRSFAVKISGSGFPSRPSHPSREKSPASCLVGIDAFAPVS
jgi:hypothetical protein